MKARFLIYLFLLGITFETNAQSQKSPIATKVSEFLKENKQVPTYRVFQPTKEKLGKGDQNFPLKNHSVISLDLKTLKKLVSIQPEFFEIKMPSYQGVEMNCYLYKVDNFTEDISVLTSDGGITLSKPSGTHYRGILADGTSSVVGFSFFENEVYGLISHESIGNITIGRYEGSSNLNQYMMFADSDWLVRPNFGDCKVTDEESSTRLESRSLDPNNSNFLTTKCIRQYLECDYALYQAKGSSVTNTTNYITSAFNNVATLYANDGMTLRISQIFVWTTLDSYSRTDAGDALDQFKAARPSVNGDLAHLTATGGNGLGGIAWRDVLCTPFKYAYSDINTTFNNVPTYSWTINVMAHETGHNVASPHTHACSWVGGALDNCYETEGGCSPGPAPTNGGTIMSYCHLTSAGVNFNNGFGAQPGALMRTAIDDASCLSLCGTTACTPPNITITGSSSICSGSSVTLTASGATTYLWTPGNFTTARIVINPSETTIYTVRGTTGACSTDSDFPIEVNESPTLELESSNITCFGMQNGLIQVLPLGGIGPFTYNIGQGWVNSSAFSNLAPGNYTVSVTDVNGCRATSSVSIIQPPRLTATSSFMVPPCPSTPFNVFISANGGVQPYSGIGTFPGEYGPTVYTVYDENACSVDVTVNAVPQNTGLSVTLVGETVLCPGQTISLIALSAGDQYEWSNGGITNTIHINTPGTYTVTVTNNSGCVAISSRTITNNGLTVNITSNGTICAGSSGMIQASSNTSNGNYTWSSGQTGSSIMVTQSGTYTVTVTSASGCVVTTSTFFEVLSNPNATIFGNSVICNGSVSTLSVGQASGNRYIWQNGSTNSSIIAGGSGVYSVTVTNAANCMSSSSLSVVQAANLRPVIMGSTLICKGSQSQLTLNSNYQTVRWSNGSSAPSLNVTSGIYTVTVSDAGGCTGVSSITIVENPPLNVQLSNNTTLCKNQSINLQIISPLTNRYVWSTGSNASGITVGNIGSYTVTVTDEAGCTSSLSTQVTVFPQVPLVLTSPGFLCDGSSTLIVTSGMFNRYVWSNGSITNSLPVNVAGTYTVQVTDQFGCTQSAQTSIRNSTVALPIIQFQPSICSGSTTPVGLLNFGQYSNYLWSNGASNQNSINLSAGSYALTVSNQDGCRVTQTFVIRNYPTNIPKIVIHGNLCKYGKALASVSGTFQNYHWSNGSNTKTTPIGTESAISVNTMDQNGCEQTANVSLNYTDTLEAHIEYVDGILFSYLKNGTGTESYRWSNGSTDQAIKPTGPGTYCVTVTDRTGCGSSTCFTIERRALAKYDGVESIKLFPNPVNSMATLLMPELMLQRFKYLNIMDLQGRQILRINNGNGSSFSFDTKGYPSGTYYIQCIFEDQVMVIPLVKI